MLIAIDFDETLTADAQLWREFIISARALGHRVICITARRLTDENIDIVEQWFEEAGIVDVPAYFTNLSSKTEYAKSLGLSVDIWIDDDPRKCALGH